MRGQQKCDLDVTAPPSIHPCAARCIFAMPRLQGPSVRFPDGRGA